MKAVAFTIPGQPIGKPRMTQRDKWLTGARVRPEVLAYRRWADLARIMARPVFHLVADPGGVILEAFFERPSSWSAKRKASAAGRPHRGKPDVDNVAKALLDALFGADEIIHDLRIRKSWDDGKGARLEVRIIEMEL